jgi:hypothetical protein
MLRVTPSRGWEIDLAACSGQSPSHALAVETDADAVSIKYRSVLNTPPVAAFARATLKKTG